MHNMKCADSDQTKYSTHSNKEYFPFSIFHFHIQYKKNKIKSKHLSLFLYIHRYTYICTLYVTYIYIKYALLSARNHHGFGDIFPFHFCEYHG